MTTMTETRARITGGVDTHRDVHVAAALDERGALLGTAEFDTTSAGYTALLRWLSGFGDVDQVGVEGTGTYGAGLARHLHDHGVAVVEVDRPNRQRRRRTVHAVVAAVVMLTAGAGLTSCQEAHPMVFPVGGGARWSDTFGAPRSGGRTHQGQDLLAAKRTPVVAADSGVIVRVRHGNDSLSGNALTLVAADGWTYSYVHLNNDAPGTDDGSNRYDRAFADGIVVGQRVKAGEIIGWVGDSGNAEGTAAHLHFEMRDPDGRVVNPASSLRGARQHVRPEAVRRADVPLGTLETASRTPSGKVVVSGWALDAHQDAPVRVTVYVNGNPAGAPVEAGLERPDIGDRYGRGTAHGFRITGIAAPAGASVCVIAHSHLGGGGTRLGCSDHLRR